MFDIKMGIPEMKEFWEGLKEKIISNTATIVEVKLYKKLGKAFCNWLETQDILD